MLIITMLKTDNAYNEDIKLFDFDKNKDTSMSALNFNLNFYEILKDKINTDEFNLHYNEPSRILDFIEDDKELNKLLVSLRKKIQNDHTDIVCKTVTGFYYPSFNEARRLKDYIANNIADAILDSIKKDLSEDFDKVHLVGFETKIHINKIPLYYNEDKFTTSKYIEIYPNIEYPDDKVKTIIKDKLADLQRVFEDTVKERDLDNEVEKEDEEEIER